jgi:hypothetical protein
MNFGQYLFTLFLLRFYTDQSAADKLVEEGYVPLSADLRASTLDRLRSGVTCDDVPLFDASYCGAVEDSFELSNSTRIFVGFLPVLLLYGALSCRKAYQQRKFARWAEEQAQPGSQRDAITAKLNRQTLQAGRHPDAAQAVDSHAVFKDADQGNPQEQDDAVLQAVVVVSNVPVRFGGLETDLQPEHHLDAGAVQANTGGQ